MKVKIKKVLRRLNTERNINYSQNKTLINYRKKINLSQKKKLKAENNRGVNI